MLQTPFIVIITMNFNILESCYCSPVLIPYSTFVYRAGKLKRAPCLIYDIVGDKTTRNSQTVTKRRWWCSKVWQRPPPRARAAHSEKVKNKKITRRINMSRRYAGRQYVGDLGPSRVRTRIPTTRQLGQWVSLRKILRFRVRLQLSQSCCLSLLLAMSGRVFLFFPPRGHEPPPTLRDRLNPNISL